MEYKKFTRLAYFLAISILLGLIESVLPVIGGTIPGLKLGLSNIITIVLLYTYGFKEGLLISVLRVIVIGILRTGLFSTTFLLSISGALLSVIVMNMLKKCKLSVIGVSMGGALFHSVGQILMAIMILNTKEIIYYLPYLMIFSLIPGFIIGVLSKEIIKYLEKRE